MSLKTKNLDKLKEKLSKKLDVGTSRIRLTPEALKVVYKNESRIWTAELVNEVKPLIKIIPKKKRLYKIYKTDLKNRPKTTVVKLASGKELVVKNRLKNYASLNYLVRRKIVSKKQIWIRKVRELRAYLKSEKSSVSNYRLLRNKIKANHYRSTLDLKRYIQNEKHKN